MHFAIFNQRVRAPCSLSFSTWPAPFPNKYRKYATILPNYYDLQAYAPMLLFPLHVNTFPTSNIDPVHVS